jgi:hypothetical protein
MTLLVGDVATDSHVTTNDHVGIDDHVYGLFFTPFIA